MALGVGLAITAPIVLRTHGTNLKLGSPGPSGIDAAPPPALVPSGSTQPGTPAGTVSTSSSTPGARHATRPSTSAGPASSAASPKSVAPPNPVPTSSAAAGPLPSPSAPASSATPTPVQSPVAQISVDQAAAFEDQVISLTNEQRTVAGCGVLRMDTRLRAAAIEHSVDMRARNYFDHNTPDGVTPWARIAAQGYSDPSAENIAMGQQTPQQVVDAWMASPGHRANILNCSSKAIGVGVQFGPNGPWWTQDFGYS